MAKLNYADKIICPYCHYEFDASFEYLDDDFDSDGDEQIIQCEQCEKEFKVTLYVNYSFSSYPKEAR